MVEKSILLVDDNEQDVFLAQRALKKNNIANQVIVANDGEEALDYLFGVGKYCGRNLNEMPAVTLLDLKMPRIDGLEVLKQVRANALTRHIPIVILTSSREDSDKIKSYTEGCNAYVTKPVDFDEFTDTVKHIGQFWLILNEPPPAARG